MIKWLFEIVVGWPWCAHKWNIIRRGSSTFEGSKVGEWYHLQCTKCGDVKYRDL